MLVVHVHVQVKPEYIDAFRAATMENARQSVQEPGIARFDVEVLSEFVWQCYPALFIHFQRDSRHSLSPPWWEFPT